MRKTVILLALACSGVFLCAGIFKWSSPGKKTDTFEKVRDREEEEEPEEEGKDGYDEAAARDQFEFNQIKDPALGYVPMDRMLKAVEYTKNLKIKKAASRIQSTGLTWTERGPIYDTPGPGGNSRGGGGYTSGRTAAILIDTLNDPTGNTVFCGGIAGGLWKCTNFLSAIPNWVAIDDRFDNLAISSICQDPTNPSILYFSTGEATSNSDAVYGGGIWKSDNAGTSWTKLSSSTGFVRTFKIACDAAGNVFVANRNTGLPVSQPAGLYRSKDQGSTWLNITPNPLSSSNSICTDIEISTTGKLHASFGYGGNIVQHVFTTDPANVTDVSWNTSSGIRIDNTVPARRLELATRGDILYAVTTNSSNELDSCYKSVDGGATWTKQNTTAFSTNILNGQGWYNLTLAINPSNFSEFIVGGLDAYKSTNSGATIPTRLTYWVSSSPYVHADHHFMQWWMAGAQSRIVIGSDGGIFLSTDGGGSFADKNRNLAIKQFYSGAIHPDAGSCYLLAGAQDNGVHQLVNPGLSSSTEVTGGDGCFVHINQQNPQIQFGSYVYNQYRRSTDGGATWSGINLSSANGLFVNPFDYDDGQNIMYASYGNATTPNNQILRWANANTGTSYTTFTLSALTRSSNSNATAFKVSPYTANRVYIGSSRGKLVRLDNGSTVTSSDVNTNVTDITGASFPVANLSCVNTGSSDNYLVAVFSNYGVGHVWYSTNGGASWTLIDGNLPDMPVRWAVFDPQHDDRLWLATEAGIYSTSAVNGAGTVWDVETGFPTVRTDMLKIRSSDNTILAATHGRGLFTAVIPSAPEIRFSASSGTLAEATTGSSGCLGYQDYTVNVSPVAAPTGDATVTYTIQAGNTATRGVDFDFTTNGSFASPSNQHVFSSGAGSSKALTIRVYDDAAIETTESFTITFTVSGTTNAFAGSGNTYQVNITDNDQVPALPGNYSVGSYSVNLNATTALRSDQLKHRVQMLFKASELTALGASAGNITSLTMRVVTKNSTQPFLGYTISMANTMATNLSTGYASAALTQVYTGDYSSVVGDNTFAFGTGAGSASYFSWDGTSNIVIQFCFDNSSGTADASADIMEGDKPFGSGTAASNYPTCFSNGGTSSGCSLAAASISNARVNARFIFGNPVATVLNTSKTTYFGANNDVYFYSSSGQILARVTNFSGHDYGCTQVSIDRAGTGAVAFWNTIPSNYLMSKTFHIVPATNNSAGQYQVTLFFTAAEKAGWEAATGNLWNNIKLIKVKSQIRNYSPSTPLPDGAGTYEVVTPVLGTFGSDYTLTYTFSSGFSGFGAGIPNTYILPVALLNFQGRLEKNTALMEWSTTSEHDSKNFEVEKSTDGLTYYKIGSVTAAGNSTTRKNYSFRDLQLNTINYYRLRMNDINGVSTLSEVVTLNYEGPQNVWIVNNPFNDYIDLRFAKPTALAKVQLINLTGAVVFEKTLVNPIGQVRLNIKNSLSRGTYILRTFIGEKQFSGKVIKQ